MRAFSLVVVFSCTPLESGDDLLDAGPDTLDACPAPSTGCPPRCARTVEILGDDLGRGTRIIAIDQRLTCDRLYRLADPTYVEPGATLVIDPGVIVEASSGAFLAVQEGASIRAEGNVADPIVFTSASSDPSPGDWSGLLLFGDAPANISEDSRPDFLRWVNAERSTFGGADTAHACGSLRYVRIEYAGRHQRLGAPIDFVALTLAGCGTATVLDYVQIHATRGEATQFVGGDFPVRHMVITEQRDDDAVNWNLDWQGSIQWLVAHHSGNNDANSIEGRVSEFPLPDRGPVVANATLINRNPDSRAAMYLTAASGMQAFNILVSGSRSGMLVFPATLSNPGFFDVDYFTLESVIVDDAIEFAEDEEVRDRMAPPMRGNRSADPMLDPSALEDDLTDPDFRPSPMGPAISGGAEDLETRVGLETTDYIGAFDPNGEDWTEGWTRY